MNMMFEFVLLVVGMITISWVLPTRLVLWSQVFLTGVFLLFESPASLIILSLISLGNYFLLHHSKLSNRLKMGFSVFLLVILLSSAKILFAMHEGWVLPIGISYYTFRNIHYSIEYYKGNIRCEPIEYYLAYNFFLPTLLIGPINRFPEFLKEWQRRRFNSDYFSMGLQRLLFGASKIVILGNYLFTFRANALIFSFSENHPWLSAYAEAIRFVLNAYYQFAGYSDLAIGFALLMGIRINENFNNPYWASNMQEFWSRYHMSLSSFCLDYIYSPIASTFRKPVVGIFATMIIIGLWHQINLPYFIWGITQALAIYISGLFPKSGTSIWKRYLGRFFVFNFFALSCILVSRENLNQAIDMYKILFFLN